MSDFARLTARITGEVQGVGFRYFVRQQARFLGLTGYARNLATGNAVEVIAEGEQYKLDQLLDSLRAGPPGAQVDDVHFAWEAFENSFVSFEIRR